MDIYSLVQKLPEELVGIIEKIPAEVEAGVSEKYHVDVLSAVCDKIPYLGAAEVPQELKDLCTAKAQELSQVIKDYISFSV